LRTSLPLRADATRRGAAGGLIAVYQRTSEFRCLMDGRRGAETSVAVVRSFSAARMQRVVWTTTV